MDTVNREIKDKPHKYPLRITDTTLRDAHQSLWATRMRIDDILKIIDVVDSVGYYSLEMWGGATFDVCLRFLRENPWERLRKIKAKAGKTPLQMLLRGQNILGYRNYPDDLLDRFIALACYNGIDIFRVFDALNDTRNLEYAIRAIKRHGGHVQGTLSYTISPYHTIESFVKTAREQVEIGIDTLCIKDMAGILSPIMAEKLVSALVEAVDVPIQLHCHCSSGMAYATYVEGVRAGAGAIDCAISSIAGFNSQPPVETMVAIFNETEYPTGLDVDAMTRVAQYFDEVAPALQPNHGPLPIIDPGILLHQIPGGMISNLRSQLAQQKALDRLNEVLAEVPKVRADLGYPPLVTPTSQIVGTQAVMNVLTGERYKIIPNEVKNYVKGLYGRPPGPMDEQLIHTILGNEKTITHRPADDLEPILPKAAENLDSDLIEREEDIISYCLFPEQALEYFKWRSLSPEKRPPAPAELELRARQDPSAIQQKSGNENRSSSSTGAALMNSSDYHEIHDLMIRAAQLNITELVIRKGDAGLAFRTDGQETFASTVESSPLRAQSTGVPTPTREEPSPEPPQAETGKTINSPLVGKFYTSSAPSKPAFVNVGDTVKAGDTVCLIEAMKLINEIKAQMDCVILKILVDNGENVEKGQPLLLVEEI